MNAPVATGGGRLLLALTLLNVLNFADRYLLISFSPAIIADLALTNLQFGLLTGLVFTGVYTVIGLFTGSLADRVHRPRLIAAGLALWSGLTAVTGVARNFVEMAAARMLIGVGEACLTPAAMSMLADRFPPARRAFASGVYYMGLPLGIGGSFLFAGALGPVLGWRGSFILLGLVGVAAALGVALLMRESPRGALDAGAAAGARAASFADSFRGMVQQLRGNRAFTLTITACTIVVFVQGSAVLDLVWWVKERGYALAEAQRISGFIFLGGGILGAVLGGVGGDWAHRRFAAGRLKFLGWVFLTTIPLVIGYRLVPGHTAAFYLTALSGAVLTLVLFGPAFTAVQELVPVQHRASAVALLLLFSAFIGAGGGNATVGWLADVFTARGLAEPITKAVLVTQAVGLLAIPLFFLAAREQQRQASGR